MIYSTLDSFYLSDEQLENSPSRQDGVDAATEAQLRQFGCDLIQEAGILLRLPQAVMATSQVLLQRFYCKRSLRKLDVKVAAMAAFWLGAKLEEVIEIDSPTKLRLRDVLTVFYRLIRRREGRGLEVLDPYSKKYEEVKAEVVRAERHLLRSFGFIVHVEQPHRFVLSYAHLLDWPREHAQEAWNIANDSLRTTLCVRYKAEVVACGILFLAARRLKVPMPESPPWWEAFEATQEQVHRVAATLLELYSRPKAQYISLGRDVTSRAAVPGQPSPKTTNVTPMRSPLPEPSLAASGAVTYGGGGGGGGGEAASNEAKGGAASEGGCVSTAANGGANGVASEAKKSPRSEAAAPGSGGGSPSNKHRDQQQQPQRRRSRSRSTSRETGRKRSRSGERRGEGPHKHRHRSRGDSRDRRRDRDRDDRRDGSRHRDRPRSHRSDDYRRDRDRDARGGSSRR